MRYITDLHLTNPISPDTYLHRVPAVRAFAAQGQLDFTDDVTFFVGENGIGKSTLLEAIAVHMGFNLEGGSQNFCFSTRERTAPLADYTALSKVAYPDDGFFFKAESFYNAATYLEELHSPSGYGDRLLHEQSHGEKFLTLLTHRFRGRGLYLLDEPESALSPTAQLTLLSVMHALVKKHSQFIISTHSPILLAYPDARIYEITPEKIRDVSFQETSLFALYKDFLTDPDRFLFHLFGEEH